MKRSLRLPFSLLSVVAVLTLLSCRAAVLRVGFTGYSPAPETPLNETLLQMAAEDLGEEALQREAIGLLDGNLPSAARRQGGSATLWRGEVGHRHYHPGELPSRARLRLPKDYSRILPEFRRALSDWFRSRSFQPTVMQELLAQVKGAIDHDGGGAAYRTCAVVGNSGILLRRDDGDLIDGHEMVIRLNNARISEYKRHTGSKTSISFVNSNILRLCARRDDCFCHPYGRNVPIVMYICQAVHFLDYAACNASHTAPLIVTKPQFDLLCARIVKYYSLKRFAEETGRSLEEWSKAHDKLMFHYSSGMQAVMLALGICDQVSVFGFGKSPEAKHHYHTNQKAELDLHDYEAEYEFYRDLVERPQVIPFLKDSGFKVPPVVFYR